MKRAIVLTVAVALSQAIAAYAGPEVSSKQVVTPPPPPPPEYFRPNEFDIGAFGTYVDFPNSRNVGGSVHGWGGGMDFTYWFPWKYAGVRFQGTGLDLQGGNGNSHRTVVVPGFAPVTVHTGGGSTAAGVINADMLLRLPLDDFWPGVHLAPYVFGGFGGILLGGGGGDRTVSEGPFTVTNAAGESRVVTFHARVRNGIRNNIGTDRVLGRIGGGLEYRITPHIGIFSEASYVIPNGSSNNFVQFNFIGLRYAF